MLHLVHVIQILTIMGPISEEVFDFSRGNLTQAKIAELKESLTKDFYGIYQLCEQILAASNKPTLVKVTLEALKTFLSWIPLGYIFETQMVGLLVRKVCFLGYVSNVES